MVGLPLAVLASANFFLMVFNLLPAYPLDGGHTLDAWLGALLGPVWSVRIVAGLGLVVAAGVALFALPTGFFLLLVALFLAQANWQALQSVGGRVAEVIGAVSPNWKGIGKGQGAYILKTQPNSLVPLLPSDPMRYMLPAWQPFPNLPLCDPSARSPGAGAGRSTRRPKHRLSLASRCRRSIITSRESLALSV